MFNRLKYNAGKFNAVSGMKEAELTGSTSIKVGASGSVNVRKAAGGSCNLVVGLEGELCRRFWTVPNLISMSLDAQADINRLICGLQGEFDILIEANADRFNAYGTEYVDLSGLQIKPGSELKIDTENMTVELDGQNVIDQLSSDSDFFNLRPGENSIVYKDGTAARKVQIRILWKDRWL